VLVRRNLVILSFQVLDSSGHWVEEHWNPSVEKSAVQMLFGCAATTVQDHLAEAVHLDLGPEARFLGFDAETWPAVPIVAVAIVAVAALVVDLLEGDKQLVDQSPGEKHPVEDLIAVSVDLEHKLQCSVQAGKNLVLDLGAEETLLEGL